MPLPKGETPVKKAPKESKENQAAGTATPSATQSKSTTRKRSKSSNTIDQDQLMSMIKKNAAAFMNPASLEVGLFDSKNSAPRHTPVSQPLTFLFRPLQIHVDGEIMAKCSVKLKKGKKDGRLGRAGGKKGARTMSCSGEKIVGTIAIAGCNQPIAFGIDPASANKNNMYVYEKHRRMATVLSGESSEQGTNSGKDSSSPETQVSVDVALEGHPKSAKLMVTIRRSTEVEKRRNDAKIALKEAEGNDSYQKLHGQIVKARQSGVDASDIDRAQEVLKTLQPETLDKEEIKTLMAWDKVTHYDHPDEIDRCQASADCKVHEAKADGEEIEFIEDALTSALKGMKGKEGQGREESSRMLFEHIVDAALAFPAGSVWKAGGKFILSHPDRNQAPAALLLLLTKHGKGEAAEALSRLIQWTEAEKDCVVTACQLNLHANEESFHAQHRDIFSIAQKEKAGRDCTCSFTTCIGTMCFSIGSSRQMQLSTMVDQMSEFNPCCSECTGHKQRCCFQNGQAMWFNDVWNKSHTHGIPVATHLPCGPRISIAMLCAPKPTTCRVDFGATANGISSTAVLNQKFF